MAWMIRETVGRSSRNRPRDALLAHARFARRRAAFPVRSAYLHRVSFRFERRARSRKARTGVRAWFSRPPDAREVAERVRRLVPRLWKDVQVARGGDLVCAIHPAAPPLRIAVTEAAELVI